MRHDKILALAKGFRGRNKNCFRIAKGKVDKALQYAYRDRKTKKRDFRSLWIQRINAATREHGLSYNQFMSGLSQCNISLNRKVLSTMAVNEPLSFKSLVDTVAQTTLSRQIFRRIDEPILRSHVATVIQDFHVAKAPVAKSAAVTLNVVPRAPNAPPPQL